jgi:hypothetical protein
MIDAMNLEVTTHAVGGREYEIRARQTCEGWEVGTFYHGKQIGPVYRAAVARGAKHSQYNAKKVVQELMAVAKSDLDAWNVKCY